MGAVIENQNDLLPIENIERVDESLQGSAMSALLTAGQREPSLVDCISFAVMRKLEIRDVFAFDKRFAE
jgi:predicted nucleic acid-binding protein